MFLLPWACRPTVLCVYVHCRIVRASKVKGPPKLLASFELPRSGRDAQRTHHETAYSHAPQVLAHPYHITLPVANDAETRKTDPGGLA